MTIFKEQPKEFEKYRIGFCPDTNLSVEQGYDGNKWV